MLPGDIIAFGGNGFISTIIKEATKSNVSHIGIIMHVKVPYVKGYINQIIESTSLGDGFAGVQINRMSIHIEKYKGDIWWLPLSPEARGRLDQEKFFTFLLNQVGKKYDARQAFHSAIDFLPDTVENFDRLFCSELAGAALESAGVIPPVNASELTPADVCMFDIYKGVYQLKGIEKET